MEARSAKSSAKEAPLAAGTERAIGHWASTLCAFVLAIPSEATGRARPAGSAKRCTITARAVRRRAPIRLGLHAAGTACAPTAFVSVSAALFRAARSIAARRANDHPNVMPRPVRRQRACLARVRASTAPSCSPTAWTAVVTAREPVSTG